MSPGELLDADDHLSACATCRESAAGGGALPTAFAALREELQSAGREAPEHFSYEQLAAYVDHEMGEVEREIAAAHLESCAECAEEVRDLLAFRATIPSGVTPTQAVPVPIHSPSLRDRLASFRRRPALLTPLRLTATAALALLAFATWLLLSSRGPVDQARTDVADTARVESSSPTPGPQSPTIVPPAADTAEARQNNVTPQVIPPPVIPPPADASTGATAGAAPEIVVALNDAGGRVTLDRRGNVVGLGPLDSSSARAVRTALHSGRAPVSASLSELVGRRGTTLGGTTPDAAFSPSSPVGTVVRGDRPTMRWRPLEGASSYVVVISDSDLNALHTSPPLKGTEWTPPHPLRRGGVYTWQVTAVKDGAAIVSPAAPEPEARFKVLEQAGLEELRGAAQSHADSHLALGVLYARAGLLDDAEREFQTLAEKNPRSPVARKLLRSVRRLRRPE